MSTRIANIISILCIIAFGAYIAWVYPGLPDPMPTHWNAADVADDYMPKPAGSALLAAIPLFVFVVFKLIPMISPRGFRTETFSGVLNTLMTATVVFGCAIGIGAIQAALGADIKISTFTMVAVGLLLMVVGNLLGKVRKNFFLGIRTPWTLASDEVWAKTHRLGGWCFVIAGFVMIVTAFASPDNRWLIWIVVGFALVPIVCSYFAYRRVEGFAPDPPVEED